MREIPYIISNQVLDQFVKFNKCSIENFIKGSFYQKNIVSHYYNQLCFNFNKDNCFIYIIDLNYIVSDMLCCSYDQLITGEFLDQFNFIKNSLPIRLKRWVSDTYLSLLKNEIIDALIYNKIVFYNDSSNRVIFEWRTQRIKFELSENLSFYKVSAL